MSGQQRIYVDFSIRDPEGRLYIARLDGFAEPPALGSSFVGTDFDEFEVACRVMAVDHAGGVVYHRPIEAAQVPGTSPEHELPEQLEAASGLDASSVRTPELSPR